MDTLQIFKKTLGLVWRYRALWLFGSLLALTMNNTLWLGFARNNERVILENRILLSNGSIINFPGEGLTIDFRSPGGPVVKIEGLEPGWYGDLIEDSSMSEIWALLISIGVVLLFSILLAALFRYTSKVALIRMVDEYERSEKMVSFRQGLRLGWSRVAGKLFLIDLSIILPVILVFSFLFFLAISPFFLFGLESITESVVSVFGITLIVSAGLLLFSLFVIVAVVILSITRPVMHQACAVDGLGVTASIRQGFHLLKTRFVEVIITWLVCLAVRFVWTISVLPVMIILFPVMIFTILIGVMIGAIITLLVASIASLFVSTIFAGIMGVLFALPLFVLVTFLPITFLSGLVEVFKSSFWTLSYREFRPLTSVAPQPADQQKEVRLGTALAQ